MLEYFFRYLAIAPDKSGSFEAMMGCRKARQYEKWELGSLIIPATFAATLLRLDLANEIIHQPFVDFIKPNLGTIYGETTYGKKSTGRFSYIDDVKQR